jgi:hypothetical protein
VVIHDATINIPGAGNVSSTMNMTMSLSPSTFTGTSSLSAGMNVVKINHVTVTVSGVRSRVIDLGTSDNNITDVTVSSAASSISVIVDSEDSSDIPKVSTINIDTSKDPSITIDVELSSVLVSDIYASSDLFVVGPEDEMDQYSRPGQLYYQSDNSSLHIFLPIASFFTR